MRVPARTVRLRGWARAILVLAAGNSRPAPARGAPHATPQAADRGCLIRCARTRVRGLGQPVASLCAISVANERKPLVDQKLVTCVRPPDSATTHPLDQDPSQRFERG